MLDTISQLSTSLYQVKNIIVQWFKTSLRKFEFAESNSWIVVRKVKDTGVAVAEWSKALLVRDNKRKAKKIPGLLPGLGNLKFFF